MKICKQKTFLWSKFYHRGNDMELLMKFHTINHSHYHHLITLIKWTIFGPFLHHSIQLNNFQFTITEFSIQILLSYLIFNLISIIIYTLNHIIRKNLYATVVWMQLFIYGSNHPQPFFFRFFKYFYSKF